MCHSNENLSTKMSKIEFECAKKKNECCCMLVFLKRLCESPISLIQYSFISLYLDVVCTLWIYS